MKMVKKLPLLLLVALPFFTPVQSRAGVIGDIIKAILGDNKKEKTPPKKTTTGNSVPLDGGVVFLMVAGLGLGAKMIYDTRTQKKVAVSSL